MQRTWDRSVVIPALLAISGLLALLWHDIGGHQAALLLVGLGLGFSLLHSALGFSGAWKNLIEKRRSRGVRAQLWLLGLSALLFIPLIYQFSQPGSYSPALAPAGLSVLIGAFLFGIGMQLGSGCGSGTLYTVGGGHINMLVTLAFFILGAFVATTHSEFWSQLPALGAVSLPRSLGWWQALLLQLLILMLLYGAVSAREKGRYGDLERLSLKPEHRFDHNWLQGPWPLAWGAIALSLLGLATLLLAGHTWSITFAFGLWGAKIWQALGGELVNWSYWLSGYPAQALDKSVLADVTSVMDIGIILGAVLAAGLANSFDRQKTIRWRLLLVSALGGLLLGYGARLAYGCNIGSLLAGIASGSLHGWFWLAAGFVGSMVGVRLRRKLMH
jgi:uncharacterized membrane protein YedE/YeeE